MVDKSGQRQCSDFHVVKTVWDGIGGLLAALFTPMEFGFGDEGGYPSNSTPDCPSVFSGTGLMSLCSRECPGCGKQKGLGHFYATYGNVEYKHCSDCRMNGRSSAPYTAWGHPVSPYYQSGAYVPVRQHKRKPDYFHVEVYEASARFTDQLLNGEQWITWDRLCRENVKKKKQRRRNRIKTRRGKSPPWKIYGLPRSHYEKYLREHYERLWKAGMDECLPTYLLNCTMWSQFWYQHRKTPLAQEKLKEEDGEGAPWKKGFRQEFPLRS